MNVEAINKTIALIEASAPERVQMRDWFSDSKNWCKTNACIAGWVIMANLKHKKGIKIAPSYRATMILDLDYDTTDNLFVMRDLSTAPAKYMRYYELVKSTGVDPRDPLNNLRVSDLGLFDMLPATIRKQAAINVLTILRDTGKVDWLRAIEEALPKKE